VALQICKPYVWAWGHILSQVCHGALRLQNEDMLKEPDALRFYAIKLDTIEFSTWLVNFKNENKNEYRYLK